MRLGYDSWTMKIKGRNKGPRRYHTQKSPETSHTPSLIMPAAIHLQLIVSMWDYGLTFSSDIFNFSGGAGS